MFNAVTTLSPLFLIGSSTGNEDNHIGLNQFKLPPYRTSDCGVSFYCASEYIFIDLQWEKCCDHSGASNCNESSLFMQVTKDN